MRRVLCGQWEFDPPDSEQGLELAIVAPSRHSPDLSALLAACGASARHGPPPVGWVRRVAVAAHLERFAGIVLPVPPECQAVILRDDWDDVELGVAFGSVLVWYH